MMSLVICLLIWIPAVVHSQCQFFPDRFFCTGIDLYDFKYYLYKNQDYFYKNLTGNASNYQIEIVNSNYTTIKKIVNPPTQNITITLTKLKINNCSVEYIKEDAFQKLSNLSHLDLSWNNLENISFVKNLPSRLDYLDLSYNKIKRVDFSAFTVSKINFSHNLISTLLPAYFDQQFKFGDFSNNKIKEFDEVKLNCLFKSLNLNYNILVNVSFSNYFYNFDNIAELRDNQLSLVVSKDTPYRINILDLTNSVFNLTKSLFVNEFAIGDKLVVRNCVIPSLNNQTLNLTQIHRCKGCKLEKPTLDFSNSSIKDIAEYYFEGIISPLVNLSLNNLETLKRGVFQNANLTTLDISWSKLKYIEKGALYELKSETIYLHGNQLNTTKNICEGVSVQKIDLSFNLIETVSRNSFSGCHKLRNLIMANSLIGTIEPQAFGSLTDLQVLDLKNNKISVLQSNGLYDLPLRKLELQGNTIETIRHRAFNYLPNLQNLNLSYSGIKRIEPDAFVSLNALEEIDLTGNNFTTIARYGFSNLPVRTIKLEGNKIHTIDSSAFSNLYRLQVLNLSSCEITVVKGFAFRNMKNIEIIDLTNNNLQILESNTFLELSVGSIRFKGNHITVVKTKAFNNLYNMRVLNISALGINHIERNAFFNLAVIEVIDLTHNNLAVLASETFFGLPVRVLELQGNSIKSIKSYAFSKLHHLRQLNLPRCNISNLEPKAFWYLPRLEYIDLRYNNISTLPDNLFYGTDKITSIILEGNNITSFQSLDDSLKLKELTVTFNGILEPDIISNVYLRKLFIKHSEIQALKNDCFIGLYNLNELHFTDSNIYSVESGALNGLFNLIYIDFQTLFKHTNSIQPGSFKDLRLLQSLDLSNLDLKVIELETFLGLENLNTLFLQNNHLDKLSPFIFQELKLLSELYLYNNSIDQIFPFSFRELNKVRKLFLQYNNLSNLEVGVFDGLKSLEELHLEYNRIESLQDYIFANLTKLKLLYLNNNHISKLHAECFHKPSVLVTLFLQSNELVDIPPHTFHGLYALEELRLDNNKIPSIGYDSVKDLKMLQMLNVSNNANMFRSFRGGNFSFLVIL